MKKALSKILVVTAFTAMLTTTMAFASDHSPIDPPIGSKMKTLSVDSGSTIDPPIGCPIIENSSRSIDPPIIKP